MSNRDEEVDDFGRIIKKDRPVDGNPQFNALRRDSFDDKRQSGGQRAYKQSRFHSQDDVASSRFQHNNSYDSRDNRSPRQQQYPQHNNNRRYNDEGSNQQYRHRSPPRSFHQQGPGNDAVVVSSSVNSLPAQGPSRITPFMNFKSFVQTLSDDFSPDIYQKMYSQYHMHYLDDFSKAFFEASKNEEWFQDRYNPIRIVERENDVKTWAAKESALLKAALLSDPAAHIAGMNLDLPEKSSSSTGAATTAPSAGSDKDDSDKEGEDSDDEAEGKSAVRGAVSAESTPAAVGANAGYIDGHADRTITIHAIHACCPKDLLRTVIIEQLTKKDLPSPERIVISDPSWNKKNREKFERTAWLIMPSAAQVSLAVHHLEGLTIEVPGSPDLETGDRVPLFHFTISASARRVRLDLTVPSAISHPERVRMDAERSARLAALLDEDRAVPVESRLASLLELSGVVSALVKPTDRLDLSIAYLRRVHFVAFYGAVRCHSEADMLLRASHSLHRSVPCSSSESGAAERVRSASNASESGETDTAAASTVGKKRRLSESEGGDTSAEKDATKEGEGEADGKESSEATTVAAAAPIKPAAAAPIRVNLVDRRIETMILDVKKRLDQKKEIAEGTTPAQGDDVDAAQLQQLCDETYQASVTERCALEKDNKARCCYGYCKKLFKDLDFLVRHLKSKHDDFARDRLVALAVPFMQSRFEKEDLGFRPLPPVEVEGSNDLVLVREIIYRYQTALQQESRRAAVAAGGGRGGVDSRRQDSRQGGGNNRDNQQHPDSRRRGEGRGGDRDGGRGGGGGGVDHSQRGSDDRDRRASTGTFRPPEQDNDDFEERRKLPVFMDVDAPKETVGVVDYGVSLPPPVKRRKNAGVAAVVAAAATTTPAAL